MPSACLDREREREREVNFDEAWHALQSNGVEPRWYGARVLTRGKQGVSKKQHGSPFIMLLK
jgi:hypothetical protein